jgi:hypothetical protein
MVGVATWKTPLAGVQVGRGVRVGVTVTAGERATKLETEQPSAPRASNMIDPKSTTRVRLCIAKILL